jgi:hypothetical protein
MRAPFFFSLTCEKKNSPTVRKTKKMRSYAQRPEYGEDISFYYDPPADPMQNFQSANLQQAMQLNATGLLPASFLTGIPVALENPGEVSWYKYAPSLPQFQNYVMASGATRIQQLARGDMGKLGTPNLLRTTPPVPLTATEPWFNGSSHRTNLILGTSCATRF